MLRRLRDYEGWPVTSSDGRELGTVEDVYFDEDHWTVRYLVVKTGGWLTGRSVLLSPMKIRHIHWDRARVEVNATPAQIERAPDADLDKPISRQWEATHAIYYGLPEYWTGEEIWGAWPTPDEARRAAAKSSQVSSSSEGQRLRSIRELSGFHIHATDGEIGHIEDFLTDDVIWTIRYFIIDTSNWIGGRSVLLAPEWAERVDWERKEVHVAVTRDEVKRSPEYDPSVDIAGRYLQELADIYRRPVRPI